MKYNMLFIFTKVYHRKSYLVNIILIFETIFNVTYKANVIYHTQIEHF